MIEEIIERIFRDGPPIRDTLKTYELHRGDVVISARQLSHENVYIIPRTWGVVFEDDSNSCPRVRWSNMAVSQVKDGDVVRPEECCVCNGVAELKSIYCDRHNDSDWRGECVVCAGRATPGSLFCDGHSWADKN